MLKIIKEFSFNRILDFFVVVVVVLVVVVQEVLHERGFSKLGASRAKKRTIMPLFSSIMQTLLRLFLASFPYPQAILIFRCRSSWDCGARHIPITILSSYLLMVLLDCEIQIKK